MNKLTLWKSASDFAFASVGITDAVELAQAEIAAFKAQGFNSLDFQLWSQFASQLRGQYQQLAKQLTPSAQAALQAQAAAPVSNAAAVSNVPAPAPEVEPTK